MLKRLLAWLGLGAVDASSTTLEPAVQPVEPIVTPEISTVVDKPIKKQRRTRKNNKNN